MLLADLGLPVFAFTWTRRAPAPGGPSATQTHVEDLAAFVDQVAERTGSPYVDLVGHSWGAVLARHVARQDPDPGRGWRVRHLVGLAPTYAGTTLHGLSRFADHPRSRRLRGWLDQKLPSWREQLAGSDVLARLDDDERDRHDAGVSYCTIVTRYDEVVTPYRAAFAAEPRARQVVVQDTCRTDLSDHVALTHDAVALWHVLVALAPHAAGPAPRGLVLPVVGGPLRS